MIRRPGLLAVLALLLAGCAGSETTAPATMRAAAAGAGSGAVVVAPGASLQAALDAVPAGGTVLLEPGVYSEAITIGKPGIRLMGMGAGSAAARAVVIRNPGGEDDGITVTAAGAGVDI